MTVSNAESQRRINTLRRAGIPGPRRGGRYGAEALRVIAADRRAADLLGVVAGTGWTLNERRVRRQVAARLLDPPPPPGHVYVVGLGDLTFQAVAALRFVAIIVFRDAWDGLT